MKAKYTEIPILNDEYKVIFCYGNSEDIHRVLKRWHYPAEEMLEQHLYNNRGICFNRSDCHPIIAMPEFPSKPEQIGTLAHEACHAVEYIFQKIQQPIGDELFAHSVGAVVRIVLKQRLIGESNV